jgi:carbon monoxide dehydrogenase subunit G
MKTIGWVVAAIVALVVIFVGYQYWRLQRAAVEWQTAKEIYSESIEQEGNTWKIKMESIIPKPVDKVWTAVKQPERSSEFIDSFKKSELKSSAGNKKVIEMQIQVLTLPIQTATIEFTFDDAAKRTTLKTLQSATQDLNATLDLQPSPDGQKTLYTYNASITPKVSTPLPVSALKGAFREQFVKTVRAIVKGVEQQEQQGQQKPAA